MVAIDLSAIGTFMPIFSFILVFTVVYALLGKTKILGEHKFVHIFVSFCVAVIFVICSNAVDYVRVTTPFFAVFIVSLLFIMLVVGLFKGNVEDFFKGKGFAIFAIIVLIVIFIGSAIFLFGPFINQYVAGPKKFVLQPQVLGAIVLIGVAAFAAWLLSKK